MDQLYGNQYSSRTQPVSHPARVHFAAAPRSLSGTAIPHSQWPSMFVRSIPLRFLPDRRLPPATGPGSGMGMSPAGIGFASVVAEAAGLFEATGSMGRESDAGSDRGRVASECGRERALSLSFGSFSGAGMSSPSSPVSSASISDSDDNASDSPEPSSSQCASSAARRGRPPKVVEIGGHQVLQTRYA
ncbi:hypothetical protein BDZ89DRAFT_1056581 [Hymenopellis radicata]|nr:hypothetical protein BDZ89DRAFT_1056581 [Hymenopellis radicata]